MTTEKVLEALSNVQEPDLGKDIVTLNMVKDLQIEGNYVAFTVVLTTPACPMKDHIKNACVNAVKLLVDKDATVNVRFTANTTTHRKDAREMLPKVKNIIAVVSGKGGVGKSTVAANFALALARGGASVGLMDADIYGPSVPIMFGVRGQRPMMTAGDGGKGMIVPLEKYGIKLMSIGLHDRLIGRPGKAVGLIKFLEHARKHDKVWFCTGQDVAEHWRRRYPPKAG